ncbi:hypothetical protein LCGC14_1649780, partial [marine sediment metagenome]
MKFFKTKLKGLMIIEPEIFEDDRGNFYRIFCENELKEIGFKKYIVQVNQSLTKKKGSIRGMHFQYPPKAEIKLVKCLSGSVFDVAIDLRMNSSTFLQWHSEILSAINRKIMYIPEGFAHGFQVLEDNSEILYLHSEFYSDELESGIRYNDPKIKIKWPLELTEISSRDKNHKSIDNEFNG